MNEILALYSHTTSYVSPEGSNDICCFLDISSRYRIRRLFCFARSCSRCTSNARYGTQLYTMGDVTTTRSQGESKDIDRPQRSTVSVGCRNVEVQAVPL